MVIGMRTQANVRNAWPAYGSSSSASLYEGVRYNSPSSSGPEKNKLSGLIR